MCGAGASRRGGDKPSGFFPGIRTGEKFRQQIEFFDDFFWNRRGIDKLDEPVQLALAEQHGVTEPIRQAAEKLLREVAELDSFGSGLSSVSSPGVQ